MESCDAAVQLPYTLLGLLLRPLPADCPDAAAAVGSRFLKDYAARGTNALLWILLIALTSLLFRKLLKLVRLWSLGNRIPGPPASPIFGHFKMLAGCGSGEHLTGYLAKLHEKYGPIVRLWLSPGQLLVSVKDTMLIKEVLVKAEDKLPLTGRAYHMAFGRSSLFVSSFEKVQNKRQSLAEYTKRRLVERASTIPLKVVKCVIDKVDSSMAKGILDCRSVSQHLAFYILGSTLFGETFFDWTKASVFEDLLLTIAKDGCFWASYIVPPFWRRRYWKYQSLCSKLKHLTQDIIQHSRHDYSLLSQVTSSPYMENNSIKREYMLDNSFLLNGLTSDGTFQDEMQQHLISEEEPVGNILSLMFHGCLATSSMISNILTRLVLHPELQEKLYLEITAVKGKTSKLDSHDVERMHLVLATVYESARLLPAGPLLQRCSLRHDMYLKSSIIPAGAILVVPLQLVQMDHSIWGSDANHFNPYRFLSQAPDRKGQSEEYEEFEGSFLREPNRKATFLPFGSGTRACIGQKLAILGISMIIASLLQNYEIRVQPGLENDPKPAMNDCVLQLLPSPKIFFVKRHK